MNDELQPCYSSLDQGGIKVLDPGCSSLEPCHYWISTRPEYKLGGGFSRTVPFANDAKKAVQGFVMPVNLLKLAVRADDGVGGVVIGSC